MKSIEKAFRIARSKPHGHVAAVLSSIRRLGLDSMIAPRRNRFRDLIAALIVARIIDPGSKLATVRGLNEETSVSSLGDILGLGTVRESEVYQAMDWLEGRQGGIETKLAHKHLSDGSLVLYDLTSAYFEGRCCPLAHLGYPRDGKKGKLQKEPPRLRHGEIQRTVSSAWCLGTGNSHETVTNSVPCVDGQLS